MPHCLQKSLALCRNGRNGSSLAKQCRIRIYLLGAKAPAIPNQAHWLSRHEERKKRKQRCLNIVYVVSLHFLPVFGKGNSGRVGIQRGIYFPFIFFCARKGEREVCVPHGEIPPRPHCRRLSLVLGPPLRPPAWQECSRRSVTVIECYEEGRMTKKREEEWAAGERRRRVP